MTDITDTTDANDITEPTTAPNQDVAPSLDHLREPTPISIDNIGGYAVSSKEVSLLFPRSPRPAEEGDANRVTLTYTITPVTDTAWRDFLHVCTGTAPTRGSGISSAMVELSMQLMMGVVANYHPRAIGYLLHEISASPQARAQMRESLRVIAKELERASQSS